MDNAILIVGDLIIDETYYVDVDRVSPEAPVPVASLTHCTPKRELGGAGNAIRYAHQQGLPYVGLCASAKENNALLSPLNVYPIHLSGKNITKTRYIDQKHKYHLLRVDNDKLADNSYVAIPDLRHSLDLIQKRNKVTTVCILNYNKGFLHFNVMKELYERFDCPFFVDTGTNFLLFSECDFIRMNNMEYKDYCSQDYCPISSQSEIIVTLGEDGAQYLSETDHSWKNVPVPKENSSIGTPDTTGCGDIFDISFCEMLNRDSSMPVHKMVEYAVDQSSKYAYKDLKTRLL
jgi:bifunctional ADP-heptose synthase (sugar kinase/adenylyltransferase)